MAIASIPSTARTPVFRGNGQIDFEERPVQAPGPGQLLLRVRANAICGTDRHQYRDGSAVTPGHEGAGVVIQSGPATSTPAGTPGVVFMVDYCGACRSCRLGRTNSCLERRADMGFSADGAYGPYELVHETNFFPVDPALELAEATLLLDVMGTSGHALGRARLVRPDIESVLVTGAGPVGLGIVAMVRMTFPEEVPVYVSDLVPFRLRLAERLGGIPLDVSSSELAPALLAAGATQVDVAIDTTGKGAARQAALSLLSRRGAFVCIGHGEGLTLDVSNDVIFPERSILGSEYFAYSELAGNHALMLANRGYISQILTHRFPVEEIGDAMDTMFRGEAGKVVVVQ